ncbi:MAG: helix-turn-helix domain-containing protein [Solirubrobacterales bacterium]
MIDTDAEPWRGLPVAAAEVIEPELSAVTEEILATIAREVPEYARPLEGSFGRGIQTGVAEALRQFVALIRDPDAGRRPGREVYLGLGRGELRGGRTLDSLQAAYRVGARVAWRRFAAAARRAQLDSDVLILLAEAIFAYIDELSADSVEGYAEAQTEVEDLRRRRRVELATLLLRDPPADEGDLRAASRAASWPLPRTVAALAFAEADLSTLAGRLPPDLLITAVGEFSCALVPDPAGPGRIKGIERAAAGFRLALGPAGPTSQLAASWSLARALLRAADGGAVRAEGLVWVDEHLGDLLLFESAALLERIATRRLATLEPLTEKARSRMRETALAYIRHRGNAVAMAAALHVHPQTARYRTARLRELLGPQLDDPDARFELEAVLRVGVAG